jgi:hypothetical protein
MSNLRQQNQNPGQEPGQQQSGGQKPGQQQGGGNNPEQQKQDIHPESADQGNRNTGYSGGT